MLKKICLLLIYCTIAHISIDAMDNKPNEQISPQLPNELWHKITADSISPSNITRLDQELFHINNLRLSCRRLKSALIVSQIFKERCDKHPLKMLMLKLLAVVPEGADNFYGLHLQKKCTQDQEYQDQEYKVDKNRLKVVYKTLLSFALLNPQIKVQRALRESIHLLRKTKFSNCDYTKRLEEGCPFPFFICTSHDDDVIKIKYERLNKNYCKATYHADRSRSISDFIFANKLFHEVHYLATNPEGAIYHMGVCHNDAELFEKKNLAIYLAQEGGFYIAFPIRPELNYNLILHPIGLLPLENGKVLIAFEKFQTPISKCGIKNRIYKCGIKKSLHLVRFTCHGTLDQSFGSLGQLEKNIEKFERAILAISPHGKIIIGDPTHHLIYWQLRPDEYESPEEIFGTENRSHDNQNDILSRRLGEKHDE